MLAPAYPQPSSSLGFDTDAGELALAASAAMAAEPFPYDVKHRKRTSRAQWRVLEGTFTVNSMPSVELREGIAKQLDMSPRAVQIWFQNRRAKAKTDARKAANGELPASKPKKDSHLPVAAISARRRVPTADAHQATPRRSDSVSSSGSFGSGAATTSSGLFRVPSLPSRLDLRPQDSHYSGVGPHRQRHSSSGSTGSVQLPGSSDYANSAFDSLSVLGDDAMEELLPFDNGALHSASSYATYPASLSATASAAGGNFSAHRRASSVASAGSSVGGASYYSEGAARCASPFSSASSSYYGANSDLDLPANINLPQMALSDAASDDGAANSLSSVLAQWPNGPASAPAAQSWDEWSAGVNLATQNAAQPEPQPEIDTQAVLDAALREDAQEWH